ncbi:hypothetical protein [Paracraurococcus ruber]|uniref:hypothetical protein n=1 Tax=Paracraurococcus ruber TaxID=77675 RepID=UPI001057F9C4|nr:hypothetical protein [Paracraurococcus ruber]
MDQIATTIAAAVEEQGAATQEIARNVAEAATGTRAVSDNIVHVNAGARDTAGALRTLQESTVRVAHQGATLREEVAGLVRGLRAA